MMPKAENIEKAADAEIVSQILQVYKLYQLVSIVLKWAFQG